MADDEPRSGEQTTANYGWTKPNVGNSDDAWGGMLNADLDGIDTTVKSVSTVANAAYPASNPSGYQTAAQVTAVLPVASSTTPLADGVAAVGVGTTYARADHVHPITAMGDNRIINGDMRIDVRNNGASGTATSVYTIDRWQYVATQSSKGTWSRAASNFGQFPYALFFQSSSAYTPLTGDTFYFSQVIEADMISDFAFGTAGAQPVTLSFWAFSSLTGTFGGAIANNAGTRSFAFSYSLPTANIWTKIVITILGDTAGTWVMSGNAASMQIRFDLGSGATYRVAAGWQNGNFIGVIGSVNVVSINSAAFYVTGVKLEIGSVATPYNRQSLAKSMADCQRYYQKLGGVATADLVVAGYANVASATASCTVGFNAMRAAPTATVIGSFTQAGPISSVTLLPGLQTLGIQLLSNAAGNMNWYSNGASTYITLSAEL
jgi:hypothetical protein